MQDSNNKKLLTNTVFLYARTLLLLGLGLFTSRITMQALGVENYGIINVVGGFVSMFALLSGSLTGACQRFITFELGKADGNVRQIFSASFYIHLFLALLVGIIAETGGLYFLLEELNLPVEKMEEAQWVFHCSVVSFVLSLLNVPYSALIIAHEKMKAFAYISLVEAFFKFLTVSMILISSINALILYSCLTLISSTLIRFTYQIYCIRTFKNEARLEVIKNRNHFKSIFGFAGWSFIGNSATILNGQGINILLNLFVGVTVNAARGISTMVESVVLSFVNNFTTALNPQITKAYAQRDCARLLELLDLGTRLSFFLMLIMIIPIVIVTSDILSVWLTVYPDYAIDFVRITLVIALIQAMANPYITAVNATGSIRNYQLLVGGLTLLNIPFSYLALKLGFQPLCVYIISLFICLITFLIRLYFVQIKVNITVGLVCKTILYRLLPILLIAFGFSALFSYMIPTDNLVGLISFGIVSCMISLSLIYMIGLSKKEKNLLKVLVKSKVRNFYDR